MSCAIAYGAVSCTVPRCGATENFVGNNGFETESPDVTIQSGRISFAANWSTSALSGGSSPWQRVSGVNNQVAAGGYAARLDADGTVPRLVAVAGSVKTSSS